MKRFVYLLGLALVLFSGCSTVKSRIQEKQHVFATLDPQTQQKLQEGIIEVGYTTDMVYIAMGKADETRRRSTSEGDQMTWIYNTYYQEYEGTHTVGYRRVVFYDRVARAYRVFYEPVRTEVYSEHEEETTRVQFTNGRVSSIEQRKN